MKIKGFEAGFGKKYSPDLCRCDFLIALSSHTVKFVEKLNQRPFFDARHIGAGNPQFLGDFPLRLFFSAVQSETVSDHFLFPGV